MGQTTFANSRGIAHKGSGGLSIAFPDVCKTPAPPAPPIPIPYPNIAKSSATRTGSWFGRRVTPVPRRIREVRSATAARTSWGEDTM